MRRQTITSCSNRACIPSKILLRPAEAVDGASNAAATGQIDNEAALAWRDHTVSNDSDAGQERRIAEHEIDLRRGRGRLVGPGVLDADGVRCTTGHVVVAPRAGPVGSRKHPDDFGVRADSRAGAATSLGNQKGLQPERKKR